MAANMELGPYCSMYMYVSMYMRTVLWGGKPHCFSCTAGYTFINVIMGSIKVSLMYKKITGRAKFHIMDLQVSYKQALMFKSMLRHINPACINMQSYIQSSTEAKLRMHRTCVFV